MLTMSMFTGVLNRRAILSFLNRKRGMSDFYKSVTTSLTNSKHISLRNSPEGRVTRKMC